ncbi:MAG: NTP transferase domain-containing protein [Phycisphaerales bacterium]|nr:MAG: NTP transferase domain-containing protein [Phycisphaerales bacterium]
MRHAIIMAGGAGERLWPLSRRNRPKQVLRLFSGKSLLRQSFERVTHVLDPSVVYVITNDTHLPFVAEELPEIPEENMIGEPVGRDTAAAVGMATAIVARRDPDATVGIFTADHIITPMDRFAAAVGRAYAMAEEHDDSLVTMGITPTRPDTNYGYVHRGEPVADGVFRVRKFTEKPDLELARQYLASGEYYWNSGMFAWKAATILAELKRHLVATHHAVLEIAGVWDTEQRRAKLESLYPNLKKTSIDFAVMEHARKVLVVEMDCNWVDVGSWSAIESVIEPDDEGNVNVCREALHMGSHENIVVSEEDHLIATIGVEGLIIVHSPDATLVCTKEDAANLKELVKEIRADYAEKHL